MSDLHFDEYRARLAQLLSRPQTLAQGTRRDIAGLFEAALARAETAEAEAAALRARVAELEAEHYALRQQLITAAQAALPGDVTITRMIVGWTDRLTGPQHIVLIGDEEE